jgi:hypothetical protein
MSQYSGLWKSGWHIVCFGILALFVAVGLSCSDDSKPTDADNGEDGPHDLSGGATAFVVSDDGGTLTTTGGITLTVDPGALPGDTSVGLIPVSVTESDDRFIAGARMEPDGLVLDSPLVVRFPLPSDWDADDTPVVYEFKGDDPSDAVETGAYARVTGSPGAYFAEVLVSHFSGTVCAKNCHAGTIRHVLEKFEERGCDRDSVLARVRGKYNGVNVPRDGCEKRGVETVQAFLDTYFEDRGGFNAGNPVPGNLLAELAGYAQSGRQVVLAFKPGTWGSRSGPNNFYPTSVTEYAHTAPLVVKNGVVQIRNTLATGNQKLINALGGENVVRYPLDQVNEFRGLQQGVAVEQSLGLNPGDLSDPSKNPYGLDIYHPIEGQSYWGRAWSDPWTYLLSEGKWSGVPPRSIPWTAVRIYVERLDGPQSELCPEEEGESTLNATVSIPGYSRSFVVRTVAGALGSYNQVGGYPGIVATNDTEFRQNSALEYDYLTVFMDKGLSAPGTFSLVDFDLDLGDAVVFFTTPLIRDAGTTYNVVFSSTSGTLTLANYGTAIGQRLKGSFNANVTGERETTLPGDENPQEEIITGTVVGSFDATIEQTSSNRVRLSIDSHRPIQLDRP